MRTENTIVKDIMAYLIEKFGVIETEIFISHIIRNAGDYTEEHKDDFDGMTLEELNKAAADYSRAHPLRESVFASEETKPAV